MCTIGSSYKFFFFFFVLSSGAGSVGQLEVPALITSLFFPVSGSVEAFALIHF